MSEKPLSNMRLGLAQPRDQISIWTPSPLWGSVPPPASPATIEAAPNTRRATAVKQVRHEVVVELAVGRTAVGDDELIGAHMHDGVLVEHGVRARGVVVEDVADELASLGLADIEVIDGRAVLTSGDVVTLWILDGRARATRA